MSASLWLCFGGSGAAALALEMLWMRSAGIVLGATAPTAGAVLACYFGGLGIGAAAASRPCGRPVRRYGLLELGVATGALWSVAVFAALATPTGQRLLDEVGTAGRLAAVALALLPATCCLGATLPALGAALAGGGAGTRGGLLYAANTVGGVAGAAAAGFGLPALVGVRASYAVAAALSALAGSVALAVDGAWPTSAGAPAVAPAPPGRARLRAVAAGAGFLGIGLEVLWTRLCAQVLHNSVYSFTAVAVVFLLALAAGAALAAVVLRRGAAETVAGVALVAAGTATVAGYWTFVRATDGLGYVGMHAGLPEYLVRILALVAASAGPAAVAAGAVLPATWAAWRGDGDASRPLGELTAANTAGAVAGALGAGFVGVPALGLRGSVLVAAAGYVLLGDALLPAARWRRPLVAAALLAVVVADPLRAPLVALRADESLRAVHEGPAGVVSVVATPDDLQLRMDNYYVLGGSAAAVNERRQGLVPLLLHPEPRRAAFIGLATGATASAAPALGVAQTTVIELVPEVATAARAYFREWNGGLLDRADVRLVVDDGRRRLAARDDTFDVIVSDLFIPWHPGTGSLYAREMYETGARRLAPGGLFCQWLPLYQLTREEFDVIARTFLGVFPDVSLWRGDFYPDRPVVALVGRLAPAAVDLDDVQRRLDGMPERARDPFLGSARALAMLYAGPLRPVDDLFAAAPVNSDERPVIEFAAPRLTRVGPAGDKDWFTGARLADFYAALDARLVGVADATLGDTPGVRDARRAGTAMYAYAVAATGGDTARSAQLERDVRALVPDVIAAADPEGPGDRALAGLRADEDDVRQRLDAVERRLGRLTAEGR